MIELFQKTPVSLPKYIDYINKLQMMFTDIGGKWFMGKHNSKLTPMKITRLKRESQKKKDNIRQNL